jgi:hypothetical protein
MVFFASHQRWRMQVNISGLQATRRGGADRAHIVYLQSEDWEEMVVEQDLDVRFEYTENAF